jgi:outer membrane protein assembly factor BamB
LESTTGNKIWSFETKTRIFASPRILNGSLFVGANDARMYEINPENGKLLNSFQVTERITNPVLMNPETGVLFLQTYANEVFCLKNKIMSNEA